MKEIVLSKGCKNERVALVDDADYDFLSQWKWSASLESRGTKWYAIRWSRKSEHGEGKPFKIRMHRVLMGLPPKDDSIVVDHKDRNGLNNQRGNLENITQVENMERAPGWKGSRSWNESKSEFMIEDTEYKYLGDFSATPPWASRDMSCNKCKVRWTGCWDNFQCPKCGEGELPNTEIKL